MVIRQSELYWVDFGEPIGSMPGFERPCVIVQNNIFNASGIATVIVAAITSNMRLAQAPGNVALRKKEAGLPKACVVNVSQLMTIDKSMLQRRIGKLSDTRFNEILGGIYRVLNPAELSKSNN